MGLLAAQRRRHMQERSWRPRTLQGDPQWEKKVAISRKRMRLFDQLPPLIRQELAHAKTPFSVEQVYQMWEAMCGKSDDARTDYIVSVIRVNDCP
jgi:hypothetical protein